LASSLPKAACIEGANGRCQVEVADIFRRYGSQYRSEHKLTPKQHAAMFDIEHCRTSYFGYHMDACDACNWTDCSHNSCRNRNCPKCQGIARRKWVAARLKDLLPVPYYHTIFTLPHLINPLVPFNKELLYEMIFASVSETLLQFGRDPKWLGAMLGFFGILHSWGAKLWSHLHIHLIVAAGGVNDTGKWIEPKYKSRFLFPVRAVSEVYRGKFIEKFKRAYYEGQLTLPDGYRHLSAPHRFERFIDALVGRNWNVHIKRPFSTPQRVVNYIGRYTHKIAISNNRLIKIEEDRVHFNFKNYRNNGRWEQTALTANEFISRFLSHVLPEGFHKIRHYGFLANGRCKRMIAQIRAQLNQEPCNPRPEKREAGHPCPRCAIGTMQPIVIVTRLFSIIKPAYRLHKAVLQHDTS
jgi:hypothetical protein